MGQIREKDRRRLREIHRANRAHWAAGTVPASELLYGQILEAALARAGISTPPLFPVGNAANAGLLYAMLRLALDFPGLGWLELGAGQSSLLLDALAKAGRVGSALTLEQDEGWARRIGAQVAHGVRHAPLAERAVLGAEVPAYAVAFHRRFDVVVVDGPVGAPRRSRWGALALLEQGLAEDFVVVFDDAERPGEQETIDRFLRLRPAARHVFIHAMKSQCLVFTAAFAAVGSY